MKMSRCGCSPQSCAVALIRCALGMILLFFGISKFPAYIEVVNGMVSKFESTWLPQFLVAIFAYVLPFVEVILGILLLTGICRTACVCAAGILFILLTFGQVVLHNADVVANNALYVFMAAVVLYLEEDDTCVLPLGNSAAATDKSGSTPRGE